LSAYSVQARHNNIYTVKGIEKMSAHPSDTHPQYLRRPIWLFLSYLVLGIVALSVRLGKLGSYVTLDEVNFWIYRSETFLSAMRQGNYSETALSTHPGVTTMWLGSFGIMLRNYLTDLGWVHNTDFATRLAFMRFPVVLAHTGAMLISYGLLQKLFKPAVAFMAIFLWAVDPFVIGYSRLLHVDALAGSFTTLSLIAAAVFWFREPRPRYLIISAIAGSLAFLSKSPSAILLPMLALIAMVAWFQPSIKAASTANEQRFFVGLDSSRASNIIALMSWGLIAFCGFVLLWPALWTDPIYALSRLVEGIESEAAEPHMLGNFFLGQPDLAPGWQYYPAAFVLHMFPRTMFGLIPLLWLWKVSNKTERHTLGMLAAYIILFIVIMSFFPKKFDRYLVPVFPALNILAAYGITHEAARLALPIRRIGIRFGLTAKRLFQGQLIALTSVAFITSLSLNDYTISSFNPLLGGLNTGSDTFLVGWGEGMEQVADWLNQQPDITGVVTVSTSTRTLQPYLKPGAQAVTPNSHQLPDKAGYVVIYIRDTMRLAPEAPFDIYYEQRKPTHVVSIAGVEYAWIYQVAPPVATPRPATFNQQIHLRGYEQTEPAKAGSTLTLQLYWQGLAQANEDYMLFAHLIGPDGQRYGQVDIPYPTSSWEANRYYTSNLPIPIAENAPAGEYKLSVGLYHAETFERLSIISDIKADESLNGPNALILGSFNIE
jgi:hypothetical protein